MKHKFLFLLILLISGSAFSNIPSDEQTNQIVSFGLKNSFDINIENERMERATRTRYNAWAKLLPTLSLSGERSKNLSESYSSGLIKKNKSFSETLYANASWKIWDNMQNITTIEQGHLDYNYQKNSSYIRIQEYIISLLELYFEFELIKQKKDIESKRLSENEKILDQTNHLFNSGKKTRMDVLDVEIQVVDAKRSLSEITTNLDIAKQNLLNHLNTREVEKIPPFDFFTLTPYFIDDFNQKFDQYKNDWKNQFTTSHYELKNLSNTLERSRLNLRQSRMSFFPSLDLTLTRQWDYSRKITRAGFTPEETGMLESSAVTLSMTWTVWDWFATPNRIFNEGSNFEIARTEYQKGIRNVEREIANAINKFELNEIQLKAAKLSLEKSELWVFHSRERFKLGRLTNMELQRSINQTYQAKVNVANYLKEKYIYMARILYHMGYDLAPITSDVPWR